MKLGKLCFPLGEWTKTEVRAIAAEIELPVLDKKESQDICFVANGCHSEFLHARRPGVDTSGRFVDTEGNVLALHGGFERFTVGQRKGMGVGFGQRIFVLGLNAETRDVVIGPWEKLVQSRLTIDGVRWLLPENPVEPIRCGVKIRYRSRTVSATVRPGDASAEIEFDEPQYGVAPGQSAVFYDDDRLLGGGVIRH